MTSIKRIFLDECGYTGEDLLNADQLVFVICTHAIDEDYCRDIKAKHFRQVNARELKHSQLCRRPRQQRMVIEALTEILDDHRQDLKLSVAHKQFALILKIVDLVIETSMHKQGFNLYEGGGHVAMATVMYFSFGVDPGYRTKLLRLFQDMMRTRTAEACAAFQTFLSGRHGLETIDKFRRLILWALLDVGLSELFSCGPNALDLSFAMAHHLVGSWRMDLGTAGFELIHDESRNMSCQKDFWDALVGDKANQARVGRGARTVDYPLCVRHTGFKSSSDSVALQLADIVAGANSYLFSSAITGRDDDYTKRLKELITLQLPDVHVWPIPEIERWPKTPVGLEDPLMYTSEVLAKMSK